MTSVVIADDQDLARSSLGLELVLKSRGCDVLGICGRRSPRSRWCDGYSPMSF